MKELSFLSFEQTCLPMGRYKNRAQRPRRKTKEKRNVLK